MLRYCTLNFWHSVEFGNRLIPALINNMFALIYRFTISVNRYPTVHGKLVLLDVGSCFNPFATYDDVYPVPIDLQPAETVSKFESHIPRG